MSETHTISIPTDNEGFVSFNCPFCSRRFKLQPSDFQADDLVKLFCPSCGLQDEPNSFLSADVHAAATSLAHNLMAEKIDELLGGLEKSFRGNKHISITRTGKIEREPDLLMREQDDLERISLNCCKKEIKGNAIEASGILYCPFCGVTQ